MPHQGWERGRLHRSPNICCGSTEGWTSTEVIEEVGKVHAQTTVIERSEVARKTSNETGLHNFHGAEIQVRYAACCRFRFGFPLRRPPGL